MSFRKRKFENKNRSSGNGAQQANNFESQSANEQVDFAKVDFSQYQGGPKKGKGNSNEFNPWKDYDRKGKSSKAKQRFKPAHVKSVSYKKWN